MPRLCDVEQAAPCTSHQGCALAQLPSFPPNVQKYESKFKELGIWYEHRLIDDMVAQGALLSVCLALVRVATSNHQQLWGSANTVGTCSQLHVLLCCAALKSEGGFIWACKYAPGPCALVGRRPHLTVAFIADTQAADMTGAHTVYLIPPHGS